MGFDKTMGMVFVKVSKTELIAEITIDERHRQPYGLVHGGVYAGMIESLCSVGAAVNVMSDDKDAVGLENNTSFLRATSAGTLRGTAHPIKMGKTTHVWQADIHDGDGHLVASGKVRLGILSAGGFSAGHSSRLVLPEK